MNEEAKLIEGCLAGKRKAQSELYQRFAPRLYGICLRYASGRAEAEDLLQEGFIRIFSNLQSYSGTGSFEGWMRRIIVNNSLNYIRAHVNRPLFSSIEDQDVQITEENDSVTGDAGIPVEAMLALVQQLPDGYRIIFNLYVFEDYSHKQIAEELSISENTSKTQLMRARAALRKQLALITEKSEVK